jgi:hypothetical protein
MRLQRVAKPFDNPDYIFELKHDGFRAIAYRDDGKCELVSRNQNHFNFLFLGVALGKLPVENAILDGEVVCLDANGVSQFNHLISRKHEPVPRLIQERAFVSPCEQLRRISLLSLSKNPQWCWCLFYRGQPQFKRSRTKSCCA